jgi:hypothetical protein
MHYRIFVVDGTGNFLAAFDAECRSHNQARAVAWGRLPPGARAEVWCGLERVGDVAWRLKPVAGIGLSMRMLARL